VKCCDEAFKKFSMYARIGKFSKNVITTLHRAKMLHRTKCKDRHKAMTAGNSAQSLEKQVEQGRARVKRAHLDVRAPQDLHVRDDHGYVSDRGGV
jgi:hypothetical protein